MGFFDSLLKNSAKKFVSNVVDKTVDKAVDGVVGGNRNGYDNNSTSNSQPNAQANNDIRNRIPRGVGPTCARIEHVVNTKFSNYELKKDVPASVMGAEKGAVPYTYALYYNGTPRAFINVIDQRNDYRLKRFRLSKMACEKNGIPHFNFFSHLPNEMGYIEERLRENV